jgi:hypothetical protein
LQIQQKLNLESGENFRLHFWEVAL